MTVEQLGNMIKVVGGGTPPREVKEYYTGHIPWVTVKDFSDELFLCDAQEHITEVAIKNSATNIIPPGNVILITRMAVGKVAINQTAVAINQDLKALICKPGLDSKYLLFYMLSVQEHLASQASGATVKGITLDDFTELSIPLPPLPEQRRIAAILARADRLRRLRRTALHLSESYLQLVFVQMFGDPVTNPMGWDVEKLSFVGSLDRGRSEHRPRNAPGLYNGPYPFIQTGDVANSSGYIQTYKQTYSERGLQQSKLWPKGTLCITIAANIAKTGILTFDACFPDSVVGFFPNTQATTEYVQIWFSLMQKQLEDVAPESAQKNINLEILEALDIAVPSIELQQRFTAVVHRYERLRGQQREALRQAEHLFQTLLHRAFRGELGSGNIEVLETAETRNAEPVSQDESELVQAGLTVE